MRSLQRTLFICFVLLTASLSINAQNNLEFSRVINQDIYLLSDGTTSYKETSITLTVPAGKVWKVESATVAEKFNGSNYDYYANGGTLVLNSTVIGRQNSSYTNGLPFWLSAGNHELILQGGTSSASYEWFGHLSIIEFSVVSQ